MGFFVLDQRDDASSTSVSPPLPESVGYIVVVVLGLLIALIMVFVSRVLKKTANEDNSKTEMFMTANRSVRTGLTASAVISSWLWSTAMLGSTLVGFNYGISGSFWFAAGCSPMIIFFSVLGIACKMRIPEAYTLLQIVRIRYGTVAHFVYMFLCLVNNLIACANMILGASAVITAMTGMHIVAATFLLPVGVVVYTFVGGIKATFLTDYIHTLTILLVLLYFSVKALTVPKIGGMGRLYDMVVEAGKRTPVAGNHDGTYLTMTSKNAILFAIIHLVSNFGLVIMDTSYFVKAFAASPAAVVPGYVIGGISYFAIPWCLGTLMSCVALALQNSPAFPTYPRDMTSTEISNGLVLPYSAMAIAGKGGAFAVLLITFMAVTSTLSAQVIAVSSIISFDVYGTYINKKATDADTIRWSHIGVVFFGIFASAFSTMLHYVGVDLGWTLYMLGVLTCPGIFPTAFTILWRKQSTTAAIVAPLLGMATGIAVWLGTAHALYGSITIASTGSVLPCMYGCVASAFSPLPYSVIITLFRPQNFDWVEFSKEKIAFKEDVADSVPGSVVVSTVDDPAEIREVDMRINRRWLRIATFWSIATFLGHWVLWPLPIYAASITFSKGFFEAWLTVSIIWLWGTFFVAVFYPLIDGRKQISAILKASWFSKERTRKETTRSSSSVDHAAAVSVQGIEKTWKVDGIGQIRMIPDVQE